MYDKPKPRHLVAREPALKLGGEAPPDEEWVTAAEFKTHCLRLMEQVRQGRTEVVVTRYGQPVARLVPYHEEAPVSIFGHLAGTVVSATDLVSPVGEAWEADA